MQGKQKELDLLQTRTKELEAALAASQRCCLDLVASTQEADVLLHSLRSASAASEEQRARDLEATLEAKRLSEEQLRVTERLLKDRVADLEGLRRELGEARELARQDAGRRETARDDEELAAAKAGLREADGTISEPDARAESQAKALEAAQARIEEHARSAAESSRRAAAAEELLSGLRAELRAAREEAADRAPQTTSEEAIASELREARKAVAETQATADAAEKRAAELLAQLEAAEAREARSAREAELKVEQLERQLDDQGVLVTAVEAENRRLQGITEAENVRKRELEKAFLQKSRELQAAKAVTEQKQQQVTEGGGESRAVTALKGDKADIRAASRQGAESSGERALAVPLNEESQVAGTREPSPERPASSVGSVDGGDDYGQQLDQLLEDAECLSACTASAAATPLAHTKSRWQNRSPHPAGAAQSCLER